jgi:prepilin-type N-terminal cleavage/methylation domain-containing protein
VTARTRTSTTGKSNERGYTLVELVVVIVILGIVLSLAVPAIRDAMVNDSLDAATRRLVGTARELRNEAVREQVDCILHLDLDGGRYWVESSDMTAEKRDDAEGRAVELPAGVRIAGVAFLAREMQTDGEATITFFRRGYTQPAIVRLGKEERLTNLAILPFGRALEVQQGFEGEMPELDLTGGEEPASPASPLE